MLQVAIDRFLSRKSLLEEKLGSRHWTDYSTLVKMVIELVTSEDDYDDFNPDPERIHCIDDGDYQGTLIFLIGAKGYQPSIYWSMKVYYGSCSGCDTLQAIYDYSDEKPTEDQVKDYYTLCLHLIESMKEI